MISSFTKCSDPLQNEFCRRGPNEWFWGAVVAGDIVVNGRDKFVHSSKDATPDPLLRDVGKPAFHLIKPGTAGGGEVRVFFKPGCDLRGLAGGVIV